MEPIDDRHDDLGELQAAIRQFVSERDWSKFHTPKNLATALSVEAGELLEPFQWLISGERHELGDKWFEAVRHEMADVLMYLICLADRLDVNLGEAVLEKLAINRLKYPIDKVRGDSRKYTDY